MPADGGMRRFPIGAEVTSVGTHIRVWAPGHQTVEVVMRNPWDPSPGSSYSLTREADGYFSGLVQSLGPRGLYSLRIDSEPRLLPDPASRFQPEGPHGPSEVIDANGYSWSDEGFRGPDRNGQVIYEMHIGTFTKAGTYAAAAEQLSELARLGITMLELMPLAEFPGRFGWGYDGVDLWAPTRLYGTPDELRSFIDAAHQLGLSVILDVVYNHLGPDGNYLKCFSPHYFTDRYPNDWGEPINFDGPESGPVREFFVQNARYWIEEFHFDGLRLDATQSIFDASVQHVITEITTLARETARAHHRRIFIVAENEPQDATLARSPERGGYGCDALWNDDFHHAAHVVLTGRTEAYYTDYRGTPQELASALKWGFLYQGQYYHWQKQCRGRFALDIPAPSFVLYLENHDQVANSTTGARLHRLADPAVLRAMTALLLLAPATPMLFQGQEFASSAPFSYFADHEDELATAIYRGRREFLQQFRSISYSEVSTSLHDPSDAEHFERCKLDFSERESHRETYALFRDLLKLRREDPVFWAQDARLVESAVLSTKAFLLRFFGESGTRLVLVNLGDDLELIPAPEPLLAPPKDHTWHSLWCSESLHYGGRGFAPAFDRGKWRLTARSTEVLVAVPERDSSGETREGSNEEGRQSP